VARPGLFSNGNPLPDDRQAYLEPSVAEGMPLLIGRDPRTITVEQLNALGHEKQPLLRVIRTNCIECCGGNEAEVRRCRLHWCPLWPYRMATNPFTSRGGNPAALQHINASRLEARNKRAEIPEGAPKVVE